MDKEWLWTFRNSFNCCFFSVHKCCKCKHLWTEIWIWAWANLHLSLIVLCKTVFSIEGSDITMMQNNKVVQISFPLALWIAFLPAYWFTSDGKRKDFPLAPPFQQFFREIGGVVLIPFAWGGHWMDRSAWAAMLFCVHAISITADCISELHFRLGSDITWMLQYAPSGTQAEFRQCSTHLMIKTELLWEWGAWLPGIVSIRECQGSSAIQKTGAKYIHVSPALGGYLILYIQGLDT